MKTTNIVWMLLLILMAAFPVAGALEIQQDQVSLQTDYLGFTSEDQSTIAVLGSITVRNSEVETLTVQAALSGLPSGYSADAIGNVTITAGNSSNIPFTVRIPHEAGSGERQIGTITVTSGSLTDSATLIQNTSSMLIIDEIEISYTDEDDDAEEDTFSQGREFTVRKDVKVATEVAFSITVENRFSDRYDEDDSKIEDIVLTVEADDDDLFPRQFQEEYDLEELDAEKDSSVEFSFTLPEDIEAGEYTITFTLEGDDGTGAQHIDEKEISFTVTRVRDDVRITEIVVTPVAVSLCDPQATVDVQLRNLGTDDQRRAALAVFSEQLGINELRQNLVLDEFDRKNDQRTERFTFELNEGVSPGQYPLDLTAFVNDDERTDTERVFLEVTACEEPGAQEGTEGITEEGAATANTTGAAQESTSKISSAVVVETTENPFTAGDIILIVMVAAVVLLLGLITILAVVLFKK